MIKDLIRQVIPLVIMVLFSVAEVDAQNWSESITDGPYIFIENDGYRARWIKSGQVEEMSFTKSGARDFKPVYEHLIAAI